MQLTRSARHLLLLVAAALAIAALPALADSRLRSAGHPEVSFTATGPAGLHIVGRTHELQISEDAGNVVVRVPLRNLSTGIDLRDQHLRNDLDIAHYRTAELVVARSALHIPSGGSAEAQARGKMKLHGQQRDVSFHYTAERHGQSIHVQATLRVKMTSFGIAQPHYLGMTVRPDVDVSASFDVIGG